MAEARDKGGPAAPAFEQGPIRPPSEANSLLVRVTRNCPWNQCEFCPVYKGERFSRRSVAEVEDDIRAMAHWHERAVAESRRLGFGGRLDLDSIAAVYERNRNPCLASILVWLAGGGRTAFLQDANNLALETDDLAAMLRFLRRTFPAIVRVTSYARSSTLARRPVEELRRLKEAGLDRVHVGLESGADSVLALVKKGADAASHIKGGRNAKAAGFELSEYIMPGLGGRALSEEHAAGTARVLSAIDPDFIRVRTLGLKAGIPLEERRRRGEFDPLTDLEMARELRLTVAGFEGIGSRVVSDHILNLLPEVEGKLPEDKEKMLAVIDRYLALPEEERLLYMVGRRLGMMEGLSDLEDEDRRRAAGATLARLRQINPDVDAAVREIASRFI
jgi:hypothetical protein